MPWLRVKLTLSCGVPNEKPGACSHTGLQGVSKQHGRPRWVSAAPCL